MLTPKGDLNEVPSFYCRLWWIALHFPNVQITKSAPAGLGASDIGLPVGHGWGTNPAGALFRGMFLALGYHADDDTLRSRRPPGLHHYDGIRRRQMPGARQYAKHPQQASLAAGTLQDLQPADSRHEGLRRLQRPGMGRRHLQRLPCRLEFVRSAATCSTP